MNKYEEMLAEEEFNWRNILVFLIQDHGYEMTEELIEDGILDDLDEEEKREFMSFLISKVHTDIYF